MPFPNSECGEASSVEHGRQRDRIRGDPSLVIRIAVRKVRHGRYADSVSVPSRKESGSTRRADRIDVKIRVSKSGRSQTIDIRRLQRRTKAAKLAKPHVIEYDEDNVWCTLLWPGWVNPGRIRVGDSSYCAPRRWNR